MACQSENHYKALSDCMPGETVRLGNRRYIVLDHIDNNTLLTTREVAELARFGADGDYENSEVRKWLNSVFYWELLDAVGRHNIVKSKVDLTADDGTGAGRFVEDCVFIPTTDFFRKYRDLIPYQSNHYLWTATRTTYENDDYDSYTVRCISPGKELKTWSTREKNNKQGVIPCFMISSSVVSNNENPPIDWYDVQRAKELIKEEVGCGDKDAQRLAERLDLLHPYLRPYIKQWVIGCPIKCVFKNIDTDIIMEKEHTTYAMAMYRMSVLIESPNLIPSYLRRKFFIQ